MTETPSYQLLTHMDLFAGIGGFRIALEQIARFSSNSYPTSPLKFITVHACDTSPSTRRTYYRYFDTDYSYFDIRQMFSNPRSPAPLDLDILTAGFPCQPFSKVTSSRVAGDAHKSGRLYLDMLRVIDLCLPKVIVLENVPGFMSIDSGYQYLDLKIRLQLNYNVAVTIADASAVVPQSRKRFVLLAVRKDLKYYPEFPDSIVSAQKPLLASILDPISLVDPVLYLSRQNWGNLELKQDFRAVVVPLESASLPYTNTPTLLANGHKGAQDILIKDSIYSTPRVLSTREMTKLMGFPTDIFRWHISRTTAHQQLGNSVVPEFIARLIQPTILDVFRTYTYGY